MASEFTDAINEAFGVLAAPTFAGTVWIWKGSKFTVIQAEDAGSFDIESGAQLFQRATKLICNKSDFPNGIPAKQDIVFRQANPNVKYIVEKDTSTENDVDPVFTISVTLKHG